MLQCHDLFSRHGRTDRTRKFQPPIRDRGRGGEGRREEGREEEGREDR
jgi:hypothetical protein